MPDGLIAGSPRGVVTVGDLLCLPPNSKEQIMFGKIGLTAVAALAMGAGVAMAGESGGCGMGAAGCDSAAMKHHQQIDTSTSLATTQPSTQPAKVYTCPMHPAVVSDKPGKCPQCGMSLQLKQDQKPNEGGPGGDQHGH